MGNPREVFEVAKRLMNRLARMVSKALGCLGRGFALLWKALRWLRSPTGLGLITVLGVVVTAVGVWYTYQSFLKHDVDVTVYDPADSQYVAGRIIVRGSVFGWPYDRVTVELAGTGMAWQGFPFVLDTTQLSEGEHQLLCRVLRGNVVVRERTVRFFVRNTPPAVSILHPQDGDVVSGEVEVIVEAEETTMGVTILLNGERSLTRPVLNTWGLADGHYTLTAIAVGPSERSGTATVGFVVDNTPPRITSLGLERSTPVSGTLRLRPEIEEENISSMAWYVDGVYVGGDRSLSLDTKNRPDGEHSIRLEVRDKVGQEAILEHTFYTDNTPPVVVLWSLAASPGRIPRSAPLFIDVIAQDESGIAEITHYANGRVIEPGWLSLSQFESGATITIRTLVRDGAENATELRRVIEVQQTGKAVLWDVVSSWLEGLGFQRQKHGTGPQFGTRLLQGWLVCSDLDATQKNCVNTPILWVECDLSPVLPLVFSGPLTLTGAGIGVYLNPHFLESSLLPTRLIFDVGGVTDISVLDRSDKQRTVLWYSFGWIGASVEVQLDYASWITGQFRFGVALLLLKSIEGYIADSDPDRRGGPGLPQPPGDRISERWEAWPYLSWWSLSLRFPLF